MKTPFALIALLLLAASAPAAAAMDDPPPAPEAQPLISRLQSAVARAACEEFVAEPLAAANKQIQAWSALPKDTGALSAEQARGQLAALEMLGLARAQLSQSRRAVLACTQLSRPEAELLLAELEQVKARLDKIVSDEVPARKAALMRQLEIAAVAVTQAPESPPEEDEVRTPAEILAAASRSLRPTGVAFLGNEYHIMLDGRRMKAGQTLKVTLDREYTVTLSAVSKNSYTLSLGDDTLVVPLE